MKLSEALVTKDLGSYVDKSAPPGSFEIVFRQMMQTWPELGARCSEKLVKALRSADKYLRPRRTETLIKYLCRLHDEGGLSLQGVAGVLERAGL